MKEKKGGEKKKILFSSSASAEVLGDDWGRAGKK